jgi:hypothetical protein
MFHPEVRLDPDDVHLAPGNPIDDISQACQRFWIAEAISYIHQDAVKSIFDTDKSLTSTADSLSFTYPKFPPVELLAPRRTPHFGLGPILEIEGTIEGTYEVIDKVFLQQLKLDDVVDFKRLLFLVYGDQKTVSLIQSVKRERQYCENIYGQYQWLLPIPGLFHWHTNFIDMIYDVYGGSKIDRASSEPTTLLHNQLYMGCVQGHKSPFHHKEEVATRAFDARISAKFYERIRDHVEFLTHVEEIRKSIFTREAQEPVESAPEEPSTVNYQLLAHNRFLCQMETYKTLKYAIKCADIGLIKRIFARCCLLFEGSNKRKYAFLSLYTSWPHAAHPHRT